jgi:5-methylcytosine-specific restriction endonuclease McrA
MIEKSCPVCGKIFKRKPSDAGKSCSRICAGKMMWIDGRQNFMSNNFNRHATITCIDCGIELHNVHITRKRCDHCAKISHIKQSYVSKQRNIEEVRRMAAKRQQIAITKDPEKFKLRGIKWREGHREDARIRSKQWRLNNLERSRQSVREYQEKNFEKVQQYRERTKEEKRERSRQYDLKHPDLRRARENRRRARKLNASGSHTAAQFRTLCEINGWKCVYCGQVLTLKTATRDHVVPLTKGGADSIDNIAPSCLKCNMRKQTKSVEEFAVYTEKIQCVSATLTK